jgi:hypothetical protein
VYFKKPAPRIRKIYNIVQASLPNHDLISLKALKYGIEEHHDMRGANEPKKSNHPLPLPRITNQSTKLPSSPHSSQPHSQNV